MGLPGVLAATFAVAQGVDSIAKLRNEDALEDFRKDQFQAVKRSAINSFVNSVDEIRVGTLQERAQIAAEIENITQEALSVRGTAAAAAATAGVSGLSVGDVQLDITRAEDQVKGRLDKLQDFRDAASALRVRGLEIQTQNRILAGIPSPFVKSSIFGEILGIGTSGLAGFGAGTTLGEALS